MVVGVGLQDGAIYVLWCLKVKNRETDGREVVRPRQSKSMPCQRTIIC